MLCASQGNQGNRNYYYCLLPSQPGRQGVPRFVIQLWRRPNMAPLGPHRPGPKAGAARAGAPPVPVGFQRSWGTSEG